MCNSGFTNGQGTAARFKSLQGIAVDSSGNVYVVDGGNRSLRKVSPTGLVTTVADGFGTVGELRGLTIDAGGSLYISDYQSHAIYKLTAAGVTSVLAGTMPTPGSTDGSAATAQFNSPNGVAIDSTNNVYVADTGNRTVRKISSTVQVSTLAGTAGQGGSADGTGAPARFSSPYGVTVDSGGNLYVVDSADNTVRKITPAGVVTTLAGMPGSIGLTDGSGSAARFSVPFDITVDSAGNLYICDHGNHAIRKVTPAGVVTTLAGSGTPGRVDGNGRAASFKFPAGIAVDSTDNVYVADTDNQVIRKISPAGDVTTVGGTGAVGSTDGAGTASSFYNPKDVAVDASGNLYVADRNNHTIRKGSVLATVAASTSDCLFNWAERTYTQYFAAGAASASYPPCYYRYYPSTANYLATSSAENHVWVRGPVSGNSTLDVGSVASFLSTAGCQ